MPNKDKTGPNGDGPQTGRKMGNCDPKQDNQGNGRGRGRGKGRGRGRGKGRGLGRS